MSSHYDFDFVLALWMGVWAWLHIGMHRTDVFLVIFSIAFFHLILSITLVSMCPFDIEISSGGL